MFLHPLYSSAGVALPLLQQSVMFWQIGLGYLLLGKRLAPIQVSLLPFNVHISFSTSILRITNDYACICLYMYSQDRAREPA